MFGTNPETKILVIVHHCRVFRTVEDQRVTTKYRYSITSSCGDQAGMHFGTGKQEGLDLKSVEACEISKSLVSYLEKCSFDEKISFVLGASED